MANRGSTWRKLTNMPQCSRLNNRIFLYLLKYNEQKCYILKGPSMPWVIAETEEEDEGDDEGVEGVDEEADIAVRGGHAVAVAQHLEEGER